MSGQEGDAEVLAAHREDYSDHYCVWHSGCSCGWDAGSDEANSAGYPTHVAAAVVAWIEETLASEAVREAVANCGGVGDYCSHTGPVVDDGCEDCRTLATAALSAVTAALRDQP